ncbi:hypothetical protein [Pollutibacter soli]|uniref:hypothetical protein n=1 Tax=Pollutibacter soli TaxID=3034157 RepID=UPI0030141240
MNSLRKYFTDWNTVKVLRLTLGTFITVDGIVSGEWLFAFAGLVFSVMSLMSVGCCGTSGCALPKSGTCMTKDQLTKSEDKLQTTD